MTLLSALMSPQWATLFWTADVVKSTTKTTIMPVVIESLPTKLIWLSEDWGYCSMLTSTVLSVWEDGTVFKGVGIFAIAHYGIVQCYLNLWGVMFQNQSDESDFWIGTGKS